MALLRQHENELKTYEELRNSTSPLDELFGRALAGACDTSPCGSGSTCNVIQPEGAYECCGAGFIGTTCTANCPSGYVNCSTSRAEGSCCAQAAGSGDLSSALSSVVSTLLPAPTTDVPASSDTVVFSILPVPTAETSTIVQAASTAVAESSAASGGTSSVLQVSSRTTLATTTSNQISSTAPATITVFTAGPNGAISFISSISTPTSQPTGSTTGISNEALTGSKASSGGLSSEGKIAIGVAIPVAFVLAVIALLFIWNRRKKNKKAQEDEVTGVPELDNSAGLPGYSASPKPDLVKLNIHELCQQPNAKEEYVMPSHNGASEMEAAMAITALRAQQLARNRSGAGMTSGPTTFEMPDAGARSPVGSEFAADQDPNRYSQNRVYEASGSPTGYATYCQPSEMPYSPVYEADTYGDGHMSYQNQNEMPGSPVSRRSELMAGSSIPEFLNRASSPPIKRKDLNSGPLVVPDELRG